MCFMKISVTFDRDASDAMQLVASSRAYNFMIPPDIPGNESQTQTGIELLFPFRGRHPLYDAHIPRRPVADTLGP
jgi:hypothetical protein